MDIENLTLKQLREIAAIVQPTTSQSHPLTPYIGRYIIVRSSASGVHAGILDAVQCTGDTFTATLRESRRLWRWWARVGVSLDGVAEHGLATRDEVRVSAQMSLPAVIAGCCEALLCSQQGESSIRAATAVQS